MNDRRHVLTALRWFTLVMLLWSAVIGVTGGWYLVIGGLRLSSRDPLRPLWAALLGVAAHFAVAGRVETMKVGRRLMATGDRVLPRFGSLAVQSTSWLALALALATVVAGIIYGSRTAGGSDSYGYVSEADLWLRGALVTPVPAVSQVPWPNALQTFTPLGYGPTTDGMSIVPICPPGLSLLMAGAKLIGGQRAVFWVVPLTAGVLVFATFGIGRRLGSATAGLAAAWCVATSPVLMSSSLNPMSDVPAAAAWSVATWLGLGGSSGAAVFSGLAVSIAILIRPNLVLIAVAIALWLLWIDRQRTGALRFARPGCFALCALPGCVAVAFINHKLYGSAMSSGYGDFNNLFALSSIAVNIRHNAAWFAETQTPIVFAGIVGVLWRLRLIWPTPNARNGALLLSLVMVAVFGSYAGYQPFEAWWFLRFLLPAWPAIFVGLAFVLTSPLARLRPSLAVLLAFGIAWLGWHTREIGLRKDVYALGAGEHRYDAVALLTKDHTEPGSILFSGQHSGSAKYYSGLVTLRFLQLPADWLDRAVDWCAEHGAHPYALLDEREIAEFRTHFGGTSARGALQGAPVFIYKGATAVYLYDLLGPDAISAHPEVITHVTLPPGATPPAPPPLLSFVK